MKIKNRRKTLVYLLTLTLLLTSVPAIHGQAVESSDQGLKVEEGTLPSEQIVEEEPDNEGTFGDEQKEILNEEVLEEGAENEAVSEENEELLEPEEEEIPVNNEEIEGEPEPEHVHEFYTEGSYAGICRGCGLHVQRGEQGEEVYSIIPDLYFYDEEHHVYDMWLNYDRYYDETAGRAANRFEKIIVPAADEHGSYNLTIEGVDIECDYLEIGQGSCVHILDFNRKGENGNPDEFVQTGTLKFQNGEFQKDAGFEFACNRNIAQMYDAEAGKYQPLDVMDYFWDDKEQKGDWVHIADDEEWSWFTFGLDDAGNWIVSHENDPVGPDGPDGPREETPVEALSRLVEELRNKEYGIAVNNNDDVPSTRDIAVELYGDLSRGGKYESLGQALGFGDQGNYDDNISLIVENISYAETLFTVYAEVRPDVWEAESTEENPENGRWVKAAEPVSKPIDVRTLIFNFKKMAADNGIEETGWIDEVRMPEEGLGFVYSLPYHYDKQVLWGESEDSKSCILVRIGAGEDAEYYLKNCEDRVLNDLEELDLVKEVSDPSAEGGDSNPQVVGTNARAVKIKTTKPLFDEEGNSLVTVCGNHASINRSEVITGSNSKNLYVATFHADYRDEAQDGYLGGKIAVYHVESMDNAYTGVYVKALTDVAIPAYDDVNTSYPIVDVDSYMVRPIGQEIFNEKGESVGFEDRIGNVPSTDFFYGYKEIELQLADDMGVCKDRQISSISCLYQYGNRYKEIPSNAVAATLDENGVATIEFKSDFYDRVLIELTEEVESDKILYHYFEFVRTGIVVTWDRTGGDRRDSLDIRHGHESIGASMKKIEGSDDPTNPEFSVGIYATFYYDYAVTESEQVDLFVTLTYKDGRRETRLLSSDVYMEEHKEGQDENRPDLAATSDFFIYTGSDAPDRLPVTVEAIAVSRPDENGKINGAKFGSGSGALAYIEIDR